MRVLLVQPPFGSLGSRSMAIPALAAHLRARGVEVSAVDANNEIRWWMLRPERLRAAAAHAERRLAALNDLPSLGFREALEVYRLGAAHVRSRDRMDDLAALPALPDGLDRPGGAEAYRAAFDLASAPLFPAYVRLDEEMSLHHGAPLLDPFSTEALDRAAEASPWIEEFLEAVLEEALAAAPDAVGLSVSFPNQMLGAWVAARVVRRLRPGAFLVVGGGFASCYLRDPPGRLFDLFDGVVLDDGEAPLEALCRAVASGLGRDGLADVPGLVHRRGGAVVRNPSAPPAPLETLPTPDYGALRYPLSGRGEGVFVSYRLSRGCWWARCAFCRNDLAMVRHHDQPGADFLHREIRRIVGATGIRAMEFGDEAVAPEVAEALFERIAAEGPRLLWWVNTRVDPRWTAERLRVLRRSGCRALRFGLESLSDRLLALLRKGADVSTIERTLRAAREAGVPAFAYMMVGLPTETEAEALAGFERLEAWMAEGLVADYRYMAYQILPGSPVDRERSAFGIRRVVERPGRDLAFPAFEFEGDGMPRRTAFDLEHRFNARRDARLLPREAPPDAMTLRLGGRDVPLRYGVPRLRAVVEGADLEDMTYGEWIAHHEARTPPLRPGAA